MSSPVVLTATRSPAHIARKHNRADSTEFLALAEELAAEQAVRTARLRSVGIRVPAKGQSVAAVRAAVERLLGADEGWAAVNLAHEFWQSLKHETGEMLDQLEVEALADGLQREADFVAAELGRTQAQSQSITVNVQVDEPVRQLTAAAGTAVTEKIVMACAAIRRAAAILDCRGGAEAEISAAMLPGRNEYETLAAIDEVQCRFDDDVLRTYRAAAVHKVRMERLATDKLVATGRIAQFRVEIENLPLMVRAPLAVECDMVEQAIHAIETIEALDQRLEELRMVIHSARARRGMFDAVIAALRRQGYEEVGELQTILPGEIRAFYLSDPFDAERAIEIGVGDDGMSLSAEAVRTTVDADASARQRDIEAQRRLCKAIEAAKNVEGDGWKLTEIERREPGEPAKICPSVGALLAAGQQTTQSARRSKAASL